MKWKYLITIPHSNLSVYITQLQTKTLIWLFQQQSEQWHKSVDILFETQLFLILLLYYVSPNYFDAGGLSSYPSPGNRYDQLMLWESMCVPAAAIATMLCTCGCITCTMYMYTHVHVLHVHVHVHMYIHVHVHMYIHVHVHIPYYMYMYIHVHVLHVYVCTCACITCICMYKCMYYMCTYCITCTCIYTCTCARIACICIYMYYMYMYVRTCTCMHSCVWDGFGLFVCGRTANMTNNWLLTLNNIMLMISKHCYWSCCREPRQPQLTGYCELVIVHKSFIFLIYARQP